MQSMEHLVVITPSEYTQRFMCGPMVLKILLFNFLYVTFSDIGLLFLWRCTCVWLCVYAWEELGLSLRKPFYVESSQLDWNSNKIICYNVSC